MTVRVVGIDLAAQPNNTALCELVVDGGAARLVAISRRWKDPELVERMVSADVVAIDAPFGWPRDYRQLLVASLDAGQWPPTPEVEKPTASSTYNYGALRLRDTDRFVTQMVRLPNGKPVRPLSVSADSIGVVAFRAAALLAQLRDASGWTFSRIGARCSVTGKRVFEVYPAATLAALWPRLEPRSGPHVNYKTASPESKVERRRLVPLLAQAAGLNLVMSAEHEAEVVHDDHRFDAFLSALTGVLAARGQTGSTADQTAASRTEGWIHFPRDAPGLSELA